MVPIKGWEYRMRINITSKLAWFAGNKHLPELVYDHAVIEVHVPRWSARKEILTTACSDVSRENTNVKRTGYNS